jgi:hypothetical protein
MQSLSHIHTLGDHRAADAAGMRTVVEWWLEASHRLSVAATGSPEASAALSDLNLLKDEWQLAVDLELPPPAA